MRKLMAELMVQYDKLMVPNDFMTKELNIFMHFFTNNLHRELIFN